ncbi:MAG: anaerobic ribonucleoside-triphosphate reductase activating protein [Candidatus Methanoperedens sp.]|nr:anaerobic ribonucleoside-triphosphate reductase activating protein [Candidatus Methanoperedens sp.]
MKLNFGGMISISTIDWYGRSVSVIFFNNCPFRCVYCQNYRLLDAINPIDIKEVEKKIVDVKDFVSGVVFSGGEPTLQYEALEHLTRFTKEHGLLVGIETNGYYPERLKRLIGKKLVDKIFLDIKAPLDDAQTYCMITGGIGEAAGRTHESLKLRGVPIEVRTTVFRSFADIPKIAKSLEGHDCTYVLQQGIPENAPDGKIQKEKPFSRDEMIALARKILFLKDVRIRTREKGEEKISPRI